MINLSLLTIPFLIYFPAILVACCYFYLISWFYLGWVKTPVYIPKNGLKRSRISVIVAFRDEVKSIQNLIHDLENQIYPSDYEVIMVDDHSSDGSFELVESLVQQKPFFKLIKSQGVGKKVALSEGIGISSGEFIITTDADCRVGENWLETIALFYDEKEPDMILGPVVPLKADSFFSRMVALEYFSLVGSTCGAAGIKHPIMSNGANMAFRTDNNRSGSNPNHIENPSGDDIFQMLNLKQAENAKINFLKSNSATVSTQMPSNLSELWQQRIRWVSKSKYYNDFDIIASSLIVWLMGIIMTLSLIGGIFHPKYFIIFLFLFLLKSIPDYLLLSKVLKFFKRHELIRYFIPLQLIYPLYVTFTGIFGLIFVKFRWKNRKY